MPAPRTELLASPPRVGHWVDATWVAKMPHPVFLTLLRTSLLFLCLECSPSSPRRGASRVSAGQRGPWVWGLAVSVESQGSPRALGERGGSAAVGSCRRNSAGGLGDRGGREVPRSQRGPGLVSSERSLLGAPERSARGCAEALPKVEHGLHLVPGQNTQVFLF